MRHDELVAWLREGDTAVRWRVERDLLAASPAAIARSRAAVATSGWGAAILARRAADGTWGGGLYTPKWTSTFYSVQLLGDLGLPAGEPRARASAALLLERGVQPDGSVRLWASPSPDTCVTAMLLRTARRFDLAAAAPAPRMVDWLLGEQLPDGGWNCRRARGATHSSFHTTLSVLEALPPRHPAAARGREFLLAHHLYRSHRTGRIARDAFTKLSFPCWWYYDVLRALEHFADARAPWDDRLADPVALLAARRRADGRWPRQNRHPGAEWLALERVGGPSRMNTVRALRVLAYAASSQARIRR